MFILDGKKLKATAIQRRMAELGHDWHVSHIYRILTGERPATDEFLEAFAEVMEVSADRAREILARSKAAYEEWRKMGDRL